jgi:anti-sigma regulatory factor (Ser/Thr protein kinase)
MASETLRITTAAADLARLYPWLDDAAAGLEIDPPLLARMHVALEEAVMNVVMHGFDSPDGQEILVRLSAGPTLTVEDAGREFNPATAPLKKAPPDDEPGGLGLKLLRHYCPNLTYQRSAKRNILTMNFGANPVA